MTRGSRTLIVVILILCALVIGSRGPGEATARGQTGETRVSALPESQSAGRTVAYSYDAAGRLISADYGEGRRIVYSYDDAGNLLRRDVFAGGQGLYLPMVVKAR